MKLASTTPRVAFENVLVATDFSSLSEPALLWAKAIARRYGSELYVTHVVSPAETALVPPEYWGSTQEAIEEAATREMEGLDTNLRGVAHKMLLQHGGVWESISEAIEKFGIDLVVMATHGREGPGAIHNGLGSRTGFSAGTLPSSHRGTKGDRAGHRWARIQTNSFGYGFRPRITRGRSLCGFLSARVWDGAHAVECNG